VDPVTFAAATGDALNQLLAGMGMECQTSSSATSSSGTAATQGGQVQRSAGLSADQTTLVTFVVITRWAGRCQAPQRPVELP
jgi:hypothetical protein